MPEVGSVQHFALPFGAPPRDPTDVSILRRRANAQAADRRALVRLEAEAAWGVLADAEIPAMAEASRRLAA